ncbi:MAG TPA: hypothetical protein VK525_09255 [Candidatus Saccharimonadales bacterium]|nr:hypothetical protein [Candidatus Saccharimonadales bacterium]
MKQFVTVDKIAEAFGISERSVQRLVIYDGMPRQNRGEYDLDVCRLWYINYLHAQVCGCAGPCNGWDPETKNLTNASAERRKLALEIADLAPKLVGLKVEVIRKMLTNAIEEAFKP